MHKVQRISSSPPGEEEKTHLSIFSLLSYNPATPRDLTLSSSDTLNSDAVYSYFRLRTLPGWRFQTGTHPISQSILDPGYAFSMSGSRTYPISSPEMATPTAVLPRGPSPSQVAHMHGTAMMIPFGTTMAMSSFACRWRVFSSSCTARAWSVSAGTSRASSTPRILRRPDTTRDTPCTTHRRV